MTIHEFRLKIYREGYMFAERLITFQSIEIVLSRFDRDGMRMESASKIDTYTYEHDSDKYFEILEECYRKTEEFIINRNTKDINTCTHQEVLLGTKIKCAYCMADLGEKITLNITDN